jgi:hypothetical protein
MAGSGEKGRQTIRPEFTHSVMIDFQGVKITSDTAFLLLRDIDDPFRVILAPAPQQWQDRRLIPDLMT